MDSSYETKPSRFDLRARWRGALAGLVPALAIALLFALGGTAASPAQVAVSLGLVTAIAVTAGWLAGPLAARQPRRLLVAAFGYAIALIATTALLSIAQGAADAIVVGGLDPVAILTAVIGRAAVALAGTAYLIIPALVLGGAWSLAARGLMRLEGSHHDPGYPAGHRSITAGRAPATLRPARDPRRLGLGAAAIIAGYALVVAAIAAGAIADGGPGGFGPPQAVPRPLLLAALFMLPAAVAVIGSIRRSRPLLVAAGAICLGQSFIAFSGVTIPFVVPALLLLALGAADSGIETSRRAVVGGVFVVILGIAAWVAPFALSETTCWVARTGPDGTVVYVQAHRQHGHRRARRAGGRLR